MVGFADLLRAPLDYALPRRCAGCGELCGAVGDFCMSCWESLRLLEPVGCLSCLAPVPVPGQICGPCLADPPNHDGVFAAADYGPVARDLVLRLKYARQPGLARVMARLMVRLAQLYPDAVLVPVPLHRWRLWARGFNQSLLIARAIAAQTGQQVLPDVLRRRRQTRPLGSLGRAARALEVRRAFAVDVRRAGLLQQRDLFLVDDVFTSGATAQACVAALKAAGARKVRVLVWARVLEEATRR